MFIYANISITRSKQINVSIEICVRIPIDICLFYFHSHSIYLKQMNPVTQMKAKKGLPQHDSNNSKKQWTTSSSSNNPCLSEWSMFVIYRLAKKMSVSVHIYMCTTLNTTCLPYSYAFIFCANKHWIIQSINASKHVWRHSHEFIYWVKDLFIVLTKIKFFSIPPWMFFTEKNSINKLVC